MRSTPRVELRQPYRAPASRCVLWPKRSRAHLRVNRAWRVGVVLRSGTSALSGRVGPVAFCPWAAARHRRRLQVRVVVPSLVARPAHRKADDRVALPVVFHGSRPPPVGPGATMYASSQEKYGRACEYSDTATATVPAGSSMVASVAHCVSCHGAAHLFDRFAVGNRVRLRLGNRPVFSDANSVAAQPVAGAVVAADFTFHAAPPSPP